MELKQLLRKEEEGLALHQPHTGAQWAEHQDTDTYPTHRDIHFLPWASQRHSFKQETRPVWFLQSSSFIYGPVLPPSAFLTAMCTLSFRLLFSLCPVLMNVYTHAHTPQPLVHWRIIDGFFFRFLWGADHRHHCVV